MDLGKPKSEAPQLIFLTGNNMLQFSEISDQTILSTEMARQQKIVSRSIYIS